MCQFDSFPTEKVKIVTINNERKVVNLNVTELTLLLCYLKCENHSHGCRIVWWVGFKENAKLTFPDWQR